MHENQIDIHMELRQIESTNNSLSDIRTAVSKTIVTFIREAYVNYFFHEHEVEWQWQKALQNNFWCGNIFSLRYFHINTNIFDFITKLSISLGWCNVINYDFLKCICYTFGYLWSTSCEMNKNYNNNI